MKRNMELGRKILLKVEEKEDFSTPITPSVVGFTKQEVVYHIKLLHQASLIEAQDWSSDNGDNWVVTSLTSIGHDFLDSARNETSWNKAKEYISSKGSVLTFETLKIALSELVKSQL
jgi:hypothetical protein